jgi:hypothetical protein
MKYFKKTAAFLLLVSIIVSCSSKSFEGTWEYNGGVYNGKAYEAFMIDGENAPEKYGSGRYEVKNDSFLVTSEFSSQPSQTLGKTIAYKYRFSKDSLIIEGVLPNGMQVEEYWKKVE